MRGRMIRLNSSIAAFGSLKLTAENRSKAKRAEFISQPNCRLTANVALDGAARSAAAVFSITRNQGLMFPYCETWGWIAVLSHRIKERVDLLNGRVEPLERREGDSWKSQLHPAEEERNGYINCCALVTLDMRGCPTIREHLRTGMCPSIVGISTFQARPDRIKQHKKTRTNAVGACWRHRGTYA